MASLLTMPKLGNTGVSSLIKSAQTLQNSINAFSDTEARITYENSAKTSADLQTYQTYLQGRIDTLLSTGSVTNATKAMTMGQEIVSATHSNISADITRENINLMSGGMGGTPQGYQDKMTVVGQEYTRALGIGDNALAQNLMSQYYSLSQSYQQAVQTASSAAASLSKAASTSGATYQGEVVTNLTDALKSFAGVAKNLPENQLNAQLGDWAKQNAATMSTLGVKINTTQPNYWDVVMGITGAIYNAKVLQAQAESTTNPLVAQTYAQEAQNYLTGATKFDTLGGSLSVQQIAEAQVNPNMFAYDNSSGTYKLTQQTGYQYTNETNANGQTSPVLTPTYSGIVGATQANKLFFLSPTQTTQMTRLGLNFTENKSGTTGNGVQVQATENTPAWLKNIMGQNGVTNMYVAGNGFLQFQAGDVTGKGGNSYFTLTTDSNGLHGIYEHLPTGETQLAGGDYGFSASAVNLLMNGAQQVQQQIAVQTAQMQAKLQAQLKPAVSLPPVQTAPAAPVAPVTQAARLQPAAPPQLTFNPQPASTSAGQTLQPTANPQTTVNGFNLNQSGSGGITLGHL